MRSDSNIENYNFISIKLNFNSNNERKVQKLQKD